MATRQSATQVLGKILSYLFESKGVESIRIPSGGTQSEPIQVVGNKSITAIQLSAGFSGANITIQGKVEEGDDFETIANTDGNALSFAVANGKLITLNPEVTIGVNYVRIISNTAEAAERILKVATNVASA